MVDRETYEALIAAEAIEPDPSYVPEAPRGGQKVRVIAPSEEEMEL